MKKLLVLMMALAMTLSLAACGGEADTDAPSTQQQGAATDGQAKADADFAKLQGFFNRIIENYEDQQAIGTLLEEVKSGQKEESNLLDAYKQLAEDANEMLQDVQSTAWETNIYDDKAEVLTACIEALALYQQIVYEAAEENDATKLETAAELAADYDEKLTAVLNAMGIE